MTQRAFPLDGYDHGPLFRHGNVRKAPRRVIPQDHGRIRRKAEQRARPPWAGEPFMPQMLRISAEATRLTGVQHSVAHIVPLQHPTVCGLHCPANVCIRPLFHNMVEGTKAWPDMWGEQTSLFNDDEGEKHT